MTHTSQNQELAPYLNPNLPMAERAADLVGRMTLEEKISQMQHAAPGIERLSVPPYNWWNECLHGVGRAGIATVFPQAIGLGATWDVELMKRVAEAISNEARAKHHEALRQGVHAQYLGLTFWSPNINIFRDPRWGRGQETYGEDPYLMARMGVAFVQGLQGDDPRYLKLVATPKHFAVHSGPEHERHHFDAQVSAKDLWETYLPAFEACVREGGAYSVMGAYNRTNGEPCCASPTLLQKILRETWGFAGYVVSDCGAIADIFEHHQVVASAPEAAALAVEAGCELNCGEVYPALREAVAQGLIDEATIDRAATRLFTARMRLGMFDPPERVPYAQIPFAVNDSPEHRALALEAARKSIVLLKNADDILPLRDDVKSIAVIGPNADDAAALLGNYHGAPSKVVTPLQGICDSMPLQTHVRYHRGCGVTGDDTEGFAEAVALARQADVTIAVMGLSQQIEGEEGQQEGVAQGESAGDRTDLALPGVQQALLLALHETGTPLIIVLLNGSAVAINWAAAHADAIVEAWYPGEEGGAAIAEVLFGAYNPAGRLPVTFYKSVDQLPPFRDYAMAGRTYRYFGGGGEGKDEEPLYPFGFGLSYTTFAYRDARLSSERIAPGETLRVVATVENIGERAGEEVVQLYLRDVATSVRAPRHQLAGFARVHLAPGQAREVTFALEPRQLAIVMEDGRRVIEPGDFEIFVGGGQPGTDAPGVGSAFEVVGELHPLI
ncbi:MAG: glycoside hydrolase family 3 C-terminal domain-containing protein [Anaerolineales bacterium]